ncbi:MAG: heavy metal-associated domain-containing protein [Eubacteriales bacterium]|nr:heavy metal-associated domain-containing protein [Eubacteriales bacterium]
MITVLKVPDMMCQHCEKAVKGALLGITGVKSALVDLEKKTVTIEHIESVAVNAMKASLAEVGYDAE